MSREGGGVYFPLEHFMYFWVEEQSNILERASLEQCVCFVWIKLPPVLGTGVCLGSRKPL